MSTRKPENYKNFAAWLLSRDFNSSLTHNTNVVCFCFYFVMVFLATIFDPDYSHDMIAYTALTIGEPEAAESHKATWAVLRTHLTKAQIDGFRPAGAFPDAHDDPQQLRAILPFFAVKAGYVVLLRLIAQVSDPVVAMKFVSGASGLLAATLLFIAFSQADGLFRFAWLPILGALDVDFLARSYSADALNLALSALSFTLLLRKRPGCAVATLIIACAVRPDSVVFNLFLSLALLNVSRWHSSLLAVSSLGCYLAITQTVDHPGWWVHFYYTFIDYGPYFLGTIPEFSVALYAKTVSVMWAAIFVGGQWALPFTLFLAILHFGKRASGNCMFFDISVASVAGLAAKLIIFPYPPPRTSEPVIIGLAFALAAMTTYATRTSVRTAFRQNGDDST